MESIGFIGLGAMGTPMAWNVPESATTEVADAVRGTGGGFVDAPVLGTVGPAERGELLVLSAAGEEGVGLPATAAAREAASATRGLGYGDEDVAALIKHLEAVTGRTVGGD